MEKKPFRNIQLFFELLCVFDKAFKLDICTFRCFGIVSTGKNCQIDMFNET